MLMMTAKIDRKKVTLFLGTAAAIIALFCFFHGRSPERPEPQGQPAVSTNESRIQYLADLGWEVAAAPVRTQEVRIPTETSEVLERYNALQKSQGFNLTNYAGKVATRYVYQINNYPDSEEPVYATILVYKNQVIGADITETAADGVIRGLT